MLLYKPWRRRIDKKRVSNAHFEPLPQNPSATQPDDEEQQNLPESNRNRSKDVDVYVEPVDTTGAAGPAHR